VSHASVLAANRSIYSQFNSEFDVTLVVPSHWRDELRRERYEADPSDDFRGEVLAVKTLGVGRPQRHLAMLTPARILHERDTQFCLIEEEPFSMAARLWAGGCRREGVPFAVQIAETLPRRMPPPIRRSCENVLRDARFVVARSPAALRLAHQWGYRGDLGVLGHGVAAVATDPEPRVRGVVGFVGRLVEAKGVDDLRHALEKSPHLRLRVAGDGPRRSHLQSLGERVEFLGTLAPHEMPAFYDSVSVVAVPSRTTRTWSEQFGRVIIEAQARATPVVAYDSGEIPWVAGETAALLVKEGDVDALAAKLAEVAADPDELGRRGRAAVVERFTDAVLAETLGRWVREGLRPRRGLPTVS
jgi:glycosyltransferase involved in cell wall biosynthesis